MQRTLVNAMKIKLPILLVGMLALCSLQAFAIDNCSAEKYFTNPVNVLLNEDTQINLGEQGNFTCFTLDVPSGVPNLTFETSSTSVVMAVKAGGYPDITKVNHDKYDGVNDCSIPYSTNDCSIQSPEPGKYRGVILRGFFSESSVTLTARTDRNKNNHTPTSFCEPFDESAFNNELEISSFNQIGKVGSRKFTCFKLAAPKHEFTITVAPSSAEGVSTLYVGKLGVVPSTSHPAKNACTIDLPSHSSCKIKPTNKSGNDNFYYMVYQNNTSGFRKGGTIKVDISGETNFSQ